MNGQDRDIILYSSPFIPISHSSSIPCYLYCETGGAHCQHQVAFLSPPVPMHGGLLCIAFRLYVTGPKVLEKKSYLGNGSTYKPQIWSEHGRG